MIQVDYVDNNNKNGSDNANDDDDNNNNGNADDDDVDDGKNNNNNNNINGNGGYDDGETSTSLNQTSVGIIDLCSDLTRKWLCTDLSAFGSEFYKLNYILLQVQHALNSFFILCQVRNLASVYN